jgi:hypothetical protein
MVKLSSMEYMFLGLALVQAVLRCSARGGACS